MGTRYLYVARHGRPDAFGDLTDEGRRQGNLLGNRLAGLPIDAVWHSPLTRASDSAASLGQHLPGVEVAEAAELIDHVPYVPNQAEMPRSWAGFFDGYDEKEATSGQRQAQVFIGRFAKTSNTAQSAHDHDVHEVLVTHAYPIAWLMRHALGAAPVRWLSLTGSANTALTVIEYRDGLTPIVVMFNDQSHLPAELRWTGFPAGVRA